MVPVQKAETRETAIENPSTVKSVGEQPAAGKGPAAAEMPEWSLRRRQRPGQQLWRTQGRVSGLF